MKSRVPSVRKLWLAVALALALVGVATASATTSASSPKEGTIPKMADFGLLAPETNNWDKGGHDAFVKAAAVLNASPTWLSNISFDQAPQVIDRLAREGYPLIISHG